jgi:predicted PurR-regulated permease PerM
MVLFFTTLFFVLWGRNELRRNLVSYFDDREARLRTLRILNAIEQDLTDYLSVVSIIYLVVGVLTGIGTYLIGYPNALVWAVLAFILNFIPYLGPLIMVLVLLAVGLISFPTLPQALLAPILYVALTTIEGHFITPSIMGRRLTLNPLIVFLALAFWTWLWGPVGAFLAVPILIAALAAIRHMSKKSVTYLPG